MPDSKIERQIYRIGRKKGMTRKQIVSAYETGLVESGIENLPGGDSDSQGWRQERKSLYPNPTNVKASINRYFDEVKRIDPHGKTAGDIAADVQRPREDLRGKYHLRRSDALKILHQQEGSTGAPQTETKTKYVPSSGTPGQTTTDIKGAVLNAMLSTKPGGRYLGAAVANITSGNYDTTTKDTFKPGKIVTTEEKVKGSSKQTASNIKGSFKLAPTAMRTGTKLDKSLTGFLDGMSVRMNGEAVEVGTGTNHSRMTTSGNVSDHWDGHGADLTVGGDSRQSSTARARGDRLAYKAFRQAGVSKETAREYAKKGGLYNIHYKGKRVQIIWKTLEGGDHYNHVHVGVR